MDAELRVNLLKVQNLLKRDPESYHDEFFLYFCHFKKILSSKSIDIRRKNPELLLLSEFISSVISCFKDYISEYVNLIVTTLKQQGLIMEHELRMNFCKTMCKFSRDEFIEKVESFETLLSLFDAKDKALRTDLIRLLASDLKRGSKKSHCHTKLITSIKISFYKRLCDVECSVNIQYACLKILIDLWRRNTWRDERVANAIAVASFSQHYRVSYLALLSLRGNIPSIKELDSDDEAELEEATLEAAKHQKRTRVHLSTRGLKKCKKRYKHIARHETKIKKKQENEGNPHDTSIIRCIFNPLEFCEKLFSKINSPKHRFEYRLLGLEILGRIISTHTLIFPKIFQYCNKYLSPHQAGVTKILQALSDSSHSLCPPDVIKPIVETLANNFVSLHNPSEICCVGIHAIRILYTKVPLAIDSIIARDLIQYAHDRKADRSVASSAKSLINALRVINPDVLPKSIRVTSNHDSNPSTYGFMQLHNTIPGHDVILNNKNCLDSQNDSNCNVNLADPNLCTSTILTDTEFKQLRIVSKKGRLIQNDSNSSSDEDPQSDFSSFKELSTENTSAITKDRISKSKSKPNPYKNWRFNPKASTTNVEKKRRKPFMMAKQHRGMKKKRTRSYSERVSSLRKALLKKSKRRI